MTVFLLLGIVIMNAQTSTDILLFDLKIEDGEPVLSNGTNITNRKGYDNQPFFHPSKPLIYFAAFNDSNRSDIRIYNISTGQTENFTNTRDSEYSPTVTADGNGISCILQRDNGAQDLVRYGMKGGKPEVLIFHLKVGYHAWVDENRLFLFVLDDTSRNSLHFYYLDKNADTVVAENIGRSLHRIPGQNAMSFVQRISDKLSVIKRYDLGTGLVSNIVYTVPGQDHLTWLSDGTILMSDGKEIFYHRYRADGELKDKVWKPVRVETGGSLLKGVSRLAVDGGNSRIAIVVNEAPSGSPGGGR